MPTPDLAKYIVTRERGDIYHLHSTTPDVRVIAKITSIRDRSDAVLGWRLKPFVVLQGATSRTWPSPADAIAATKLFTPGRAKSAVRAADEGDRP